ncbi:MAG: E3 binding domain-containing protein, partial [Alphaproteobacteria bacterium]|nr:E3 binding domain-containing protein [Alphaproteobacteria bacterium]
MATEILMPALSPTMTEGNLVKWLVDQGDRVEPGDVIAEIETDKATMEVEAVDEGIVGRIVVPEGSEGVAVNAVIAVLVEEGEELGEETAVAPAARPPEAEAPSAAPEREAGREVKATPLARRMAALAGIDIAAIAGSGAHGRITRDDVRRATGRAAPAEVDEGRERIFASPLARRMAGEAELPLEG